VAHWHCGHVTTTFTSATSTLPARLLHRFLCPPATSCWRCRQHRRTIADSEGSVQGRFVAIRSGGWLRGLRSSDVSRLRAPTRPPTRWVALRRIHPAFTISITISMDDNPRASHYTAARVTRREWKTVVLTAIERSGRRLSLWAVSEGPAPTGRWFANLTDRQTGGHVHLSSVADLGPDGMVDDLVTQLTNAERTKRLTRAHRRDVMSGELDDR
jgi:hypothetical protein